MALSKPYLSILINRDIAMKMIFVPKLLHIAVSKVAILVYSNSEVIKFEMDMRHPFHLAPNEEWEPFIRAKVSNFTLPEMLLEKVIGLMKPLSQQHHFWKCDHHFIKRSFRVINYFCWTSEGTIDWFRTAKKLVHLDDLGFMQKVLLACTYSLKDELLMLWRDASATERRNLVNPIPDTIEYNFIDMNIYLLKKWYDWLNSSTAPCPFVYSIFDTYLFIPFQTSFLETCTLENVMKFIEERKTWWNSNGERSPFRMALEIMLFQNFMHAYPYEFLLLFLKWPLQILFNEMADQVWTCLQRENFLTLIENISHKIESNWKDCDYVRILNDFWKNSPDNFKKYVENHPFSGHYTKYISM